jgi:hypothetical protein
MAFLVPFVKTADDEDPLCIGRPHREISAALAFVNYGVGTEFVIEMGVCALIQQNEIFLREKIRAVLESSFRSAKRYGIVGLSLDFLVAHG